MILFQVFFIFIIVFSLSRAILRFKEGSLKLLEIVFWLFVWGLGALIIVFPNISTYIANFFGINRGADFVIYISIVTLFYIIYRLYVKVEGLSKKLDELIRKLANNN